MVALRFMPHCTAMLAALRRKSQGALNRLWIRIAVIGVLSLVAIGVARLVRPILPDRIAETLGTDSLNDLLTIIASSMLAVVTFSLSVMVSVYRSSSSQWTPRVHRLMLSDPTTQNTLATFVGAYIFALASIVFLRTSLFVDDDEKDDDPQVVLFVFTVLVLVLIVIAMVRWILHLQRVGSLMDVTQRVENTTQSAFDQEMERPCLGGRRRDFNSNVPDGSEVVVAATTGYVSGIDMESISNVCERFDREVFFEVSIGDFIHRGKTLCYASGQGEQVAALISAGVTIENLRSFEQDPRFGVIVLGEIGSKAMSPGINDAGTAIDVIGRIGRILESYRSDVDGRASDPKYPRIAIPSLSAAALVRDGYDPLARDGAGVAEVQIALQRSLRALAAHTYTPLAQAAIASSQRAFRLTEKQMSDPDDLERVRSELPPADLADDERSYASFS